MYDLYRPAGPTSEAPSPPVAYTAQPAVPPPAPGRRPLARFAIVAVALAVTAVAAFGVGRITTPDPVVVTERVVAPTTTTPATATTTPLAATTTAPPAPTTTIGSLTGEPVAQVAALVGPAVVQLESRFGLGSGVLYDRDGYILTAAHVVEGAADLLVRLGDGRTVEGSVLGLHEPTDVAVVKINGDPSLPIAELGVGVDVQVGQMAIALGSPFGLDQTVTAGIVSSVDRIVSGVSMVQTDAAINPGNSGGPLVDGAGRVIGINDQIFTSGGGNDGIGFAISIDLAKIVADQIVAGNPVQLAFLGVSASTYNGDQAGALVQQVVPDSAAAASGLALGDVIVAVDGVPVRDGDDLRGRIITTAPGTTVQIDVMRDGVALMLEATLGSTGS